MPVQVRPSVLITTMRGSTMVVRSAVNRDVVGSSPTRAANQMIGEMLGQTFSHSMQRM